MSIIHKSAMVLAKASDGNPLLSVGTVMLGFVMFNVFEALVETLVFGERFEHFLDVIFNMAAIAYAGYSVYACAIYNTAQRERSSRNPGAEEGW